MDISHHKCQKTLSKSIGEMNYSNILKIIARPVKYKQETFPAKYLPLLLIGCTVGSKQFIGPQCKNLILFWNG